MKCRCIGRSAQRRVHGTGRQEETSAADAPTDSGRERDDRARLLQHLDISALAEELVAKTEAADSKHCVRLTTPGPLFVQADPELVGEALGRFVENARRYCPSGEPIEVSIQQADGEAVVSVRDRGVGIPHERQPHVFEPFFEPVPSGQPGYVGFGSLGLHVSKQIVQAHGGRIWFASTPGEGSTFAFSLPLLHPR